MASQRRELALDIAIAAVVFAGSLALLAGDSGVDTRDLDPLGMLLAALTYLPLIAWRRERLVVFAITATASAASIATAPARKGAARPNWLNSIPPTKYASSAPAP